MKKLSNKKDKYIEYFKNNTSQSKVLAKLFKTDSSYYIYDTGTSKVLNCSELEYKVLEKIRAGKIDEVQNLKDEVSAEDYLEAVINIRNAIDQEDILKGD